MIAEVTMGLAFSFSLAAVQLAIGFYVYLRGPRRPVSVAFTALGVSLAAWTISIGIAHTPLSGDLVVRCTFAAASLLLLSLLTFVSLFPASPAPWRSWWYVAFLVLGLGFTALAFTNLVVVSSAFRPSGLSVKYGPIYPAYGIYAGFALVGTLGVLTTKLRRSQGREYLQLRYLLLALLVPTGASAITNLAMPLVFGVSHLGRFGPVFTVVFLAVTAHAMMRQRLMDIKLVVGHTVSYGAAIIVVGVAYLVTLSTITTRLNQVTGDSRVIQMVLTFGAALLFAPVTQRLGQVFDRYCYREPYNYNELIRRSSALLSSTIDLQQLLRHLFTLIQDSVRPEFVAAYLHEADAAEFRLAAYEGDAADAGLPASIALKAAVLQRLVTGDRLLLRDAADERSGNDRRIAAWLHSIEAECVYAVVHEGDVLAIILLGRKRSDDAYFAHDLDLLGTITSQAAVAIKNAALYRHVSVLESQRQRAERVAETGALSAGIAHEIKNPLVAIRTFFELLPERYEDEEFRMEFSRVVASEISRLDRLVARLRGLKGTAPDEQQPIDVRKVLEETLAVVSLQLEQAGIGVVRQYDADDATVSGNADKLKQLLLNLLLNSVDSMAGAGGEITVRLRSRRGLGGATVSVDIEDQGTGIADDVRETLFHPFVTTKRESSGLGLWVCRQIADEHNAVLSASNRTDRRGARFTIDIPARRGDGLR